VSVRILYGVFFCISVFFEELHDRVGMHEFLVILDTLNQRLQFSEYFKEQREKTQCFQHKILDFLCIGHGAMFSTNVRSKR